MMNSSLYFIAICLSILHVFITLGNPLTGTRTTQAPCFQCANSNQCLNNFLRCDGVDDCGDASDEKNCSCGDGKFVCNNGRCIPKSWVCDTENDCYDNSDEINCTDPCIHNGGCDHICQVTKDKSGKAASKCSCYPGFQLRTDGKTCRKPCKKPGFYVRPDGTCEDVDECAKSSICDGNCINTVGSYRCECRAGFVKGKLKNTCEDIDECQKSNHGCEHLCHNTRGSYTCSCKHGYVQSYQNPKHCDDIDECAFGVPNCHVCINLAGGFKCACDKGYVQNANRTACLDVDECSNNNGGCEHICENLPGAFRCRCKHGFQLQDRKSKLCIDVNECAQNNGKGPCSDVCINKKGTYKCLCKKGFQLAGDGHTCIDIDECRTNVCQQRCINEAGGFYCDCNKGFFLAADKRTCQRGIDFSECGILESTIQSSNDWSNVDVYQSPWIVQIMLVTKGWMSMEILQWGQIGVILGEKWILTAGHPMSDMYNYRIRTNDGKVIDVENVMPYSRCKPEITECKNDIALLKLVAPISFKRSVRPICIPNHRKQMTFLKTKNEAATILTNIGPNGMLKRTVHVCDAGNCTHYRFSSHMICAGGLKGVCAGDSGSPLIFTRYEHTNTVHDKTRYRNIAYVSGILSWGNYIMHNDNQSDDFDFDEECKNDPQHLAFTNIGKKIHWIKEKTGISPRPE